MAKPGANTLADDPQQRLVGGVQASRRHNVQGDFMRWQGLSSLSERSKYDP